MTETVAAMVRNYIKKRSKPEIPEDVMLRAVQAVSQENVKLRVAASLYGINPSTLFYRVKNAKTEVNTEEQKPVYSSKYTFRQIFSQEEEEMLQNYILICSKMNYGMTYQQIKKLAYDYAKKLERAVPVNWEEHKSAGTDWLKGFMKRHTNLTLRKPENTSLSRSTSFNKTNVAEFHENLERALNMHKFSAERIFNLDETGLSTVVQSPRVVAETGAKQVGQAVSAERGSMITMCAIVSASGNTVPPVFIFPRARMHDSLMTGAPPGSLGLTNSPKSGWMTGPLFVKTLEHLQKHTRCTKDDPILLLLDNHESHCSLEAILLARNHGIVMVTFPPHCTHRLQPLDVAVLGPFKSRYAVAQNDWLVSNAGRTITIHDITGIANTAYKTSFTIKNILSGFEKPGIWPFSRNAFGDEDFAPASVTDRPVPDCEENAASRSTLLESDNLNHATDNQNSPIHGNPTTTEATKSTKKVTPEHVRPFPRAEPRENNRGGRMKRKSRILTLTPEKNRIAAERIARDLKKQNVVKNLPNDEPQSMPRRAISKRSRNNLFSENLDSDSDSDECYSIHDESDTYDIEDELSNDDDMSQMEIDIQKEMPELNSGDYVLVKFATKMTLKYFVGHILKKEGLEYSIKFLRKRPTCWKFYFPDIDDISTVDHEDLILKLPEPVVNGSSRRTVAIMSFNVDLSRFNVS